MSGGERAKAHEQAKARTRQRGAHAKSRAQSLAELNRMRDAVRKTIDQLETRIEAMVRDHAPARDIEDLRGVAREQHKVRQRLDDQIRDAQCATA